MNELLLAWDKYLAEKRRVVDAKRRTMWWFRPEALQAHLTRAEALRALTAVQRKAMLELAACVTHDARPQ